ncbi:hypothetical protein KIN20_009837 [Parelaphostrongylus tenuis]|uniref:CUB domain-containing protein n=1 Tax=Parelaphostrongylus tenuis TaxID=148309 RepID=A0AAD5MA46_PARTN|nr:hypothetical protein KIN20_009837 [Parelaphostrongylus tenuis]
MGAARLSMQKPGFKHLMPLQAPVGSKIEVRFDNYSTDGGSDGCKYSGVEIKTGNDTRLTGYRICDYKWAGVSFNSTSNIVPVIAYARFSPKTAVLSYRISAEYR